MIRHIWKFKEFLLSFKQTSCHIGISHCTLSACKIKSRQKHQWRNNSVACILSIMKILYLTYSLFTQSFLMVFSVIVPQNHFYCFTARSFCHSMLSYEVKSSLIELNNRFRTWVQYASRIFNYKYFTIQFELHYW